MATQTFRSVVKLYIVSAQLTDQLEHWNCPSVQLSQRSVRGAGFSQASARDKEPTRRRTQSCARRFSTFSSENSPAHQHTNTHSQSQSKRKTVRQTNAQTGEQIWSKTSSTSSELTCLPPPKPARLCKTETKNADKTLHPVDTFNLESPDRTFRGKSSTKTNIRTQSTS